MNKRINNNLKKAKKKKRKKKRKKERTHSPNVKTTLRCSNSKAHGLGTELH